jgi:hypothetical protein
MRTLALISLIPLLAPAAACNVDSDSGNDQIRVDYDQERIENAASTAARTAREVGSGLGNVAVQTGRAVGNEVGDIDVDVDVRRNRDGERTGNGAPADGNRQ